MAKQLFFSKSKEGVASGGAKVSLKKPYGKDTLVQLNTVTRAGGATTSVANVEGSVKVDELMAKQMKYFFDADVPVDTFVNLRVGLWGKVGENFSKFNLAEKDLYMFFVSTAKLETFQRGNGETGYQLNLSAYDFAPLKTQGTKDENAQAPAKKAAPAKAKPAPAVEEDDFEAIDDSEDLPF